MLIRRLRPELAYAAAASAELSASVQIAAVAQVKHVPDRFCSLWIRWVQSRAGVVCAKGGTAHRGNKWLGSRIAGRKAGEIGRASIAQAAPRARIARGIKHALALSCHLLEQNVLRLGITKTRVKLAQAPAAADRVGEVVVGNLSIFVQRGLPGYIVGGVIDDEMADLRRNSDLCLDVGFHLDIAGVIGAAWTGVGRTTLIVNRALRVNRAAINIDIRNLDILRRAKELVFVGYDIRLGVTRKLKDGQDRAFALATTSQLVDRRGVVKAGGLRGRQAATTRAGSVAWSYFFPLLLRCLERGDVARLQPNRVVKPGYARDNRAQACRNLNRRIVLEEGLSVGGGVIIDGSAEGRFDLGSRAGGSYKEW